MYAESKRILLQPIGPDPLDHQNDFANPFLRHENLNSRFKVALYLPFQCMYAPPSFAPNDKVPAPFRILGRIRLIIPFEGYLAHKKPPRCGSLGRRVVSCEPGTLVSPLELNMIEHLALHTAKYVCPFLEKSTSRRRLTLGPCEVQVWSRNTPDSGPNETRVLPGVVS